MKIHALKKLDAVRSISVAEFDANEISLLVTLLNEAPAEILARPGFALRFVDPVALLEGLRELNRVQQSEYDWRPAGTEA